VAIQPALGIEEHVFRTEHLLHGIVEVTPVAGGGC
jgi:hypothetical protein